MSLIKLIEHLDEEKAIGVLSLRVIQPHLRISGRRWKIDDACSLLKTNNSRLSAW